MSHRDNPIKKNKELSKPMDFFNVGFVGAVGSSTPAVIVTSGSYSTDVNADGYTYVQWRSSGHINVTGTDVEVFLVAGGGGGAGVVIGGAGGGQVMRSNLFTLPTGNQNIDIGAGGAAFAQGGDTSIGTIVAKGGAYSGAGIVGGSGSGGSGGAGGTSNKLSFPSPITGSIYGNSGGSGSGHGGGGGGGAGAVGDIGYGATHGGSVGGNGGAGIQIAFPTSYYWGGGGGGVPHSGQGGNGGSGGGGGTGHSSYQGNSGHDGSGGTGGINNGGSGAWRHGGLGGAHTGGGGGGWVSSAGGGGGGSGIAIVRHQT